MLLCCFGCFVLRLQICCTVTCVVFCVNRFAVVLYPVCCCVVSGVLLSGNRCALCDNRCGVVW